MVHGRACLVYHSSLTPLVYLYPMCSACSALLLLESTFILILITNSSAYDLHPSAPAKRPPSQQPSFLSILPCLPPFFALCSISFLPPSSYSLQTAIFSSPAASPNWDPAGCLADQLDELNAPCSLNAPNAIYHLIIATCRKLSAMKQERETKSDRKQTEGERKWKQEEGCCQRVNIGT
ncbi:hypothetical protein Q8A73_008895 [Channa argus]|nr:hypothetical protein Q8A73_008895 [Channa argus]